MYEFKQFIKYEQCTIHEALTVMWHVWMKHYQMSDVSYMKHFIMGVSCAQNSITIDMNDVPYVKHWDMSRVYQVGCSPISICGALYYSGGPVWCHVCMKHCIIVVVLCESYYQAWMMCHVCVMVCGTIWCANEALHQQWQMWVMWHDVLCVKHCQMWIMCHAWALHEIWVACITYLTKLWF